MYDRFNPCLRVDIDEQGKIEQLEDEIKMLKYKIEYLEMLVVRGDLNGSSRQTP